jgi:hypothetical protein
MADDAKLANELGVSLEDERDLHFGGWCGLFSVKGKPIVQCGSGAKRFGIDFPRMEVQKMVAEFVRLSTHRRSSALAVGFFLQRTAPSSAFPKSTKLFFRAVT